MKMRRSSPFWLIIGCFVIWRVCLFLLAGNVDRFLPYQPSFAFPTSLTQYALPRWLYSFGNFDGVHYLAIANHGYKALNYVQAFFPLYPFVLIRPFVILSHGSVNTLLLALLISNLSFIGFLCAWFVLVKRLFNTRIAWFSLAAYLLFPTSIFFSAIYTESLFLLLCTLTFLAALDKRWWLAGSLALLASATRITGIFLIPALLIELWIHSVPQARVITTQKVQKFFSTQWKHILAILLGSIGLLAYMAFLYKHFGDPLYFSHVQSAFGAGRDSSKLVLYPQVLFRSVKILATARPFDLKYFAYFQEFLAGTVGLLAILVTWKKVRLSIFTFALLSFILPTLTGTFSSMPRYILVCFPIFLLIGALAERNRLFRIVWYPLSLLWMILNAVLFLQGYWVA